MKYNEFFYTKGFYQSLYNADSEKFTELLGNSQNIELLDDFLIFSYGDKTIDTTLELIKEKYPSNYTEIIAKLFLIKMYDYLKKLKSNLELDYNILGTTEKYTYSDKNTMTKTDTSITENIESISGFNSEDFSNNEKNTNSLNNNGNSENNRTTEYTKNIINNSTADIKKENQFRKENIFIDIFNGLIIDFTTLKIYVDN